MLAPILAATPNNIRTNSLRIVGLARVLAHGIVESPLLRMTKPRAFLRALSQNRDSARVFHYVTGSKQDSLRSQRSRRNTCERVALLRLRWGAPKQLGQLTLMLFVTDFTPWMPRASEAAFDDSSMLLAVPVSSTTPLTVLT